MSIARVTLSVPKHVAARLKKAAGAKPVSAWVTELIEEHLDQADLEAQFRAFCARHAPTRAEEARAHDIVARVRGKQSSRRRSA
jgi:hypothetical protein